MPKKEDFGYTLVRGKDKVLQKFKKILLCCPSFVVANSKKQRGSNNLFSRDPIANEFIKLDNEIRIDKDNKEVKKFKKIVCSFVKISAIWLNMKTVPWNSQFFLLEVFH